ncbi:MAG: biopolymer transporter ExbD [Phycisphaerales bacterium]|nr:biopolymer transporter ExbD [Phycisphaerales bacterium]
MRTSRQHISVPGITPLVDVVFLLIVFFVLVSRVVDLDRVPMDLPMPDPALSAPPMERSTAVVNVVPGDDGEAAGYRLDGTTHATDQDGRNALRHALAAHLLADPTTAVVIRADRRARSGGVLPVLHLARRAAAEAGLAVPVRVELAVERPR